MLALSRKQVREVDRLSIEKYHIPGIVLMENAARGTTAVAMEMLGAAPNQIILILCGGGNNGGDGLAVARHLHNQSHQILIGLCTDPQKYHGDALINWQITQAMHIRASDFKAASARCALIIDAIFGTGLTETPRSPFETIVDLVERSKTPVLSIDIPSGLDCDTGQPIGPCIRATRTVTFVARKIGFNNPHSRPFTGDVTVADIGCPREAIEEAMRVQP